MSEIKSFRVNGLDSTVDKDSTEFFLKIIDDSENIACTFAIRDDGVYYYRARSRILTPQENTDTRNTWNGYLSMENLQTLFEEMIESGITKGSERATINVTHRGRSIQITRSKENEA